MWLEEQDVITTLEMTYADATLSCFRVRDDRCAPDGELAVDLVARATAGDGSLDGEFPLYVSAFPDEDGNLAHLSLQGGSRLPPDAFVEAYGVTRFDPSPYDEIETTIVAELDAAPNPVIEGGEIDIQGLQYLSPDECPPTPYPSSGGCVTYTPLASADWNRGG